MYNYAKKEYWIWLQCIMGYASNKIKKIIDFYGSPEELYKSDYKSKISSKLFTDSQIDRMEEYNISYCKNIVETACKLGQKVITIDDYEYPKRLTNIDNFPCVLYVKGNIPNLDEKLSIAVVGSRNATYYGLNTAFKFSYDMAKNNVVVVSGGARGIDIQAHKATLKADGVGICVLACGCDYPYLENYKIIKEAISNKGAIISEFMPGTPPKNVNFPIRNRIMSGLSNGVLLVEAALKSGSIITVNYALDQGRDVFVIPGNVDSPFSKGANMLIKEGAKPVTDINDILEEYKDGFSIRETPGLQKKINSAKFDFKQITLTDNIERNKEKIEKSSKVIEKSLIPVYNLLSSEPESLELIVSKSSKNVRDVLSDLTQLELLGFVESLPGKKYKKLS